MTPRDPLLADGVRRLRTALRSCPFLSDFSAEEPRITALLEQVEEGMSAHTRPFRILLTGGTGVGKSTLLNAFAGSAIALVGDKRPTTRGFVVYLHADEHDSWVESLEQVHVVRHHRDLMREKMIIDSPDADSALTGHRGLLSEAMAVADLVLLVATQEKYVSETVLDLVTHNRRGRSFAFVFNKTDLCESDEIIHDYRHALERHGFPGARIYPISARRAFDASQGGLGIAERGYARLQQFVESELDRKRISSIEKTNVEERAEELSKYVAAVLPEGWESAGERWRDQCTQRLSEFFAEIGTMINMMVLDRDELVEIVTVSRGSALSGPFGFVSELVYALRRFRSRGIDLLRQNDTDSWVREKLNASLFETVESREALVQEACCSSGFEFGLAPEPLRHALRENTEGQTETREWCETHLRLRLRTELGHGSSPPGLVVNFLVNVVPWAWIAYWGYRLLQPTLGGESPPWDAIPGAAVVLMLGILLEWSLVDSLLRWDARKRVGTVVSRVLSELETGFLGLRLPAIARVALKVQACTRNIEQALRSLEGMSER